MMAQTPTLLITDDDHSFRETLGLVFQRRGFETHLAADGEEAVKIIRTKPIHLALFDLHMPRLTGLGAVRQLLQIEAIVPWILMSGALDDQTIEEARRLHALSILSKPLSSKEVTTAVEGAMETIYDWFE